MKPTVQNPIKRNLFWGKRYQYAFFTASIAAAAYLLLYFTGLTPTALEYQPQTNQENAQVRAESKVSVEELQSATPTNEEAARIIIDEISVNTPVENPVTTSIEALNNYLSEGAVRWPTSGTPGHGNMFLFGHSSSLNNVLNQAYKAFNGLGELENGDTIEVETISGTYRYSVIDVEFQKDTAVYVPFDTGENMLTLSTCNNFGAREDRIVVRAVFEGYTPSE